MKRLSLSKGKRKGTVVAVTPTAGEIYNSQISLPPGICNAGNTCYAAPVLHCLLNHPTFRGLCTDSAVIQGDHSGLKLNISVNF